MYSEEEKKKRLLIVVAQIRAQNAIQDDENKKPEEGNINDEEEAIAGDYQDPIDSAYASPELIEVAEQLLKKECCINCDERNPVLCRAGDCPAGIYEPIEVDSDESDD